MKHWNDSELPDNKLFPEQYKVREVIRESATSTLLLGYDAVANSDVVIKCFKPSVKGAYLREISATFGIQHNNLVRCLNTFHRTDGIACIVYEYLSGGDLVTLIETQKTVEVQTIFACLQAMLNALVYLNSIDRIHCDIKPENILLRAKANGEIDYVLIDLGAACLLREAQQGSHVTGTPAYIAPERIKNRFFFNSDLYSLGVIAFEMYTGKRPFTGTVEEVTQANLSEIPSLTGIQHSGLRDFIDHLLVKNPQQRLASAILTLKLLNKIMQQSHQLVKAATQLSENAYAQLRLPITEEPLAIHCFHVKDYPLVGLVYSDYVDIIDPAKPEYLFKCLLTSYPLQILESDLLAYATPSRIQILNLQDGTELIIKEQLNDLKKWHLEYGRLIWNNSFHCFYEIFKNDAIIKKYGVPNYLFGSEVTVLLDGSFATTEGIANNKIVLRNNDVQVQQEWLLDSPVVALSHHDTTVLVITMSLKSHSAYTLWCLELDQALRQLSLPDNINQIMCINGVVFWLDNNKTLSFCNTTLQPKILKLFTANICKLAVCYDHLFIAIYYKDDNNRPFLTILKNRAVS